MRSGPLFGPAGQPAYNATAPTAAAITTTVDDSAYPADGAVALALDTQVSWVLHRTSTTPLGPFVIATQSNVGRWIAPAPVGFSLPPPRVRQQAQATVTAGLTRLAEPIDCYGTLLLSIDGPPELLRTDPAYRCQLELGRYVPKRKKRASTGYKPLPQGFYHPTPWIGGAAPAGSGGTRGGAQNGLGPGVDRPPSGPWPAWASAAASW